MGSTNHSASFDESECGEIHTEVRSGSPVANGGLYTCRTRNRKNVSPRPGTKLTESRSRIRKSLRGLVGRVGMSGHKSGHIFSGFYDNELKQKDDANNEIAWTRILVLH